jgi:glutamate-ammonia-ligase adenylyltransferase
LDLLCTVFGNSDALAFTLIRDPALIYWLAEPGMLEKAPSRAQMERALHHNLRHVTARELKLDALRRFRRREMLRIGVRDLLKFADVPATTAALSDIASVLIDAAYRLADAKLRSKYGVPMHRNRQARWTETRFAVIGMGKLGGHELNYSSDVDLIFVYESLNGETRQAGRAQGRTTRTASGISNEEYFEMLSRELTKALAEQTKEGSVFRVDLRLRAEGSVGRLARSLDDYRTYYRTRGQVWERLALLKAWPIAGSMEVGKAFIRLAAPFVLGSGSVKTDFSSAKKVIEDVRSVKEMIDTKMAVRGHERRNVKLGVGGIREIEFLVQTIQVLVGRKASRLLDRSTLGSLKRFAAAKLISIPEQEALTAAYLFLRDVEHKLQMVHDLQTHALPDGPEELERCAIRMGYEGKDRARALIRFAADHEAHTACVHDFFRSFFYRPETSPLLKAALRAVGSSRP